jgi:transposase InsO family protein
VLEQRGGSRRLCARFAAHRTIEIALALNLVPCFTPVESPESNGMAETFVKTFKRDYVRVSPIPDAIAALALVDSWMEDYNTVHPHSRLGYALLGSTSCPNPSRVRSNGVNSIWSSPPPEQIDRQCTGFGTAVERAITES